MEYKYNIINDVYNWMTSGKKNIEVRILKEKSSAISVGDFITFNNQNVEGKFVRTKVIDKVIFDSVDDLLSAYDVNRMMPDHTGDELKELLDKIYGEELVNGKLVAFSFEYISSDESK